MGIHHIALATRDIRATHRFYTEAMGFRLVKAAVAATETEGGWAKHLFYDTGDAGTGLLAFWDIHDDTIADFDPAISTSQGLPIWVNHLAFDAVDLDGVAERRQRWQDCGFDVIELDHGWCTSIYTNDPNGILVEWCATTSTFDEHDGAEALEVLASPAPRLETAPEPVFHLASKPVTAG